MNATPRIFVACLASYNVGNMQHGEWVDAIDADEIKEGIADMLAGSPVNDAEEWAIHDTDDFGCLSINEFENIDMVAEMGRLIEEHGNAFAAYADNVGIGYASESDFQDAYAGEWDTEKAFGENLFDDCYDVPDNIAGYINYQSFADDLFMGDYYSLDNPTGGIFVFRN